MNKSQEPISTVICAQCGRAPLDESELERWRPSGLAAEGTSEELAAAMLLCPDCIEDDHLGSYDTGEAD